MRYYSPTATPSGRRFSLPGFDIFGHPNFQNDLQYNNFHYPYYPPPYHFQQPPVPPAPPHHFHPHPFQGYSPIYQLQQYPEDSFSCRSIETNPFPSYSPTKGPEEHFPIPPMPLSAVLQDQKSLISDLSLTEPFPPFNIVRAETSGDCCFEVERMAPTIQGSSVAVGAKKPQADDKGTGRKHSYNPEACVALDSGLQSLQTHTGDQEGIKHSPVLIQNRPGRPTIVNGSGTDVSRMPTPRGPPGIESPKQYSSDHHDQPAAKKPIDDLMQKLTRLSVELSAPEAPVAEDIIPQKPLLGSAIQGPPPNRQSSESESVYIGLSHLPHYNKMNSIRLRANHTLTSDKAKLIEEAKKLIRAALQTYEPTKNVSLGSFFSWTVRGFHINFSSPAGRWTATDNTAWLSEIGPDTRIGEKWSGIVVHNIWNSHILGIREFDDDIKMKLQDINPIWIDVNGEVKQEIYRIRKMKWFTSSVLAIWFHDSRASDYFLNKGVWLMEGLVGAANNRSVGVCALRDISQLDETPRHHRRLGARGQPRTFGHNAVQKDAGKPRYNSRLN